jgi:hypothetical protein
MQKFYGGFKIDLFLSASYELKRPLFSSKILHISFPVHFKILQYFSACHKKPLQSSVAEPHHFYAAPVPAPGKNFDAAPASDPVAPAPAPTLLYSKAKFLKRTKF